MKQIQKFFAFVVALSILVQPLTAAVIVPTEVKSEAASVKSKETMIQEFLSLTPAKYKEMTGHKMKLPEKMYLKYQQKKMQKQINKGEAVDVEKYMSSMAGSWDWAAFALGLFLTVFGVLIVWLFYKNDPKPWKEVVIGAIIGFLLWGLIIF